jgi:hypothetical protein
LGDDPVLAGSAAAGQGSLVEDDPVRIVPFAHGDHEAVFVLAEVLESDESLSSFEPQTLQLGRGDGIGGGRGDAETEAQSEGQCRGHC